MNLNLCGNEKRTHSQGKLLPENNKHLEPASTSTNQMVLNTKPISPILSAPTSFCILQAYGPALDIF